MRLRNIPRAEDVLARSAMVIKNETACKGLWHTSIFQNEHPIHIEVGMGKGQFILESARRNSSVNYIGIERYSSVLLRAVEKLEQNTGQEEAPGLPLPNLRFLCMDAAGLPDVFSLGEVARIYLNFSDPWPKARHARRRLTSGEFLQRYSQILSDSGEIEFKTDNRSLFDFSVEQIAASKLFTLTACTYNLHQDAALNSGNIMTEYEEKFSSMNHPICKLTAKRQSSQASCI